VGYGKIPPSLKIPICAKLAAVRSIELRGIKVKEMISDSLGKALHDRSTRGEPLSAEEQAQLESWYEYQDKLESNILDTPAEAKTIAKLQAQIEAALTQLITITTRIQDVASENEILRQEINI
jgi:hypothetical protein